MLCLEILAEGLAFKEVVTCRAPELRLPLEAKCLQSDFSVPQPESNDLNQLWVFNLV